MNWNSCFILVLVLFFVNCAPSKEAKFYDCAKYNQNNFGAIKQESFKTFFRGDTISYTEIRYDCSASALYTLRTMYNHFGKWHKYIKYNTSNQKLLIWENIDLLRVGKKYNVITFGVENTKDETYCSIMVFDNRGKDVLKYDSEEKQKIIDFFATDIRNPFDIDSKEFYEVYLMTFNTLQYIKYMKWRKRFGNWKKQKYDAKAASRSHYRQNMQFRNF